MTRSNYFCKFNHETNLNLLRFIWVLEDLELSNQTIALYDNVVMYGEILN